MLHLIPAPLHRAALRIAHGLRKRWWRIARPRLRGCRVIALDGEGRVLLVRHAYGSGKWMPPGGGLGRQEDAIAGGLRELREETGCVLEDAVEVVLSEEPLHGTVNAVHIVVGRTSGQARPDGREIVETRFFPVDGLPEFMPGWLRSGIPVWVTEATTVRPADPALPRARPPAPIA
jgi:8-oxo-dGTP pyrophosphatase MutT (NUDIX family)